MNAVANDRKAAGPSGTGEAQDGAPPLPPPCPGAAVAFRPQQAADAPIVREAHAGHWRAPPGIDWPAAMLAQLVDQQHAMQERHIAARYPDAERRMILVHGTPVGRLCLDRGGSPWRIVDLALVREAQGAGTGGAVLRALLAEAMQAGVAIALEVGRDNPRAAALYRRIGFAMTGEDSDTHLGMTWQPARPG